MALFAGLFMSRVVKPLGLPAVTGYLLAGIVLGPYCLGALNLPGMIGADGGAVSVTGLFGNMEKMESMANLVQNIALGFIAFAIGTEFKLSSLKRTGKQATIIGIVQALMAMILVDGALIVLHLILGEERLPLSVCITLGAIATATAPAATVMVVKQYKAKGPLTNILLPIVALDDAVGLICFAVSIGIAQALEGGAITVISILINPLLEVILSLTLGAISGVALTAVENMFKSNSKRLCLSITFVLLTIALSQLHYTFDNGLKIGFSNLLVCMMLGTLFCNICKCADEMMERTDKWTMPIFVLFFVMSGSHLEFSIFKDWVVILVGVIYIIFRSVGKYIGAYGSAKATKCEKSIVRYLGITLLPQAGVSLGMSVIATAVLSPFAGSTVRNIVLFAVMIYELIGPMLTKIALTHAGDITPKPVEHHHKTMAEVFADDIDEDDTK
ncbi:MAG: cation:proton antiporter [Clostridia bacterium]|nr:cation:proton antiporter [Clostridia bacterium]